MSKSCYNITLKVLLGLNGFAAALILLTVLLSWFPQVLPKEYQSIHQYRDNNANRTITRQWTTHSGDLVELLDDQLTLPPEETILIPEITTPLDANGFVMSTRPADHYPIIALGDSYNFSILVETSWLTMLSDALDTPIQNLSYEGYGLQEQLDVLAAYGSPNPDWIILTYFEGNDLIRDVPNYRPNDRSIQWSILSDLLIDFFHKTLLGEELSYGEAEFPISVSDTYEMAFFPPYFWGLNAKIDTFERSRNVETYGAMLAELRADYPNTCLLMVYIPTKSRVYFPLLTQEQQLIYLTTDYAELTTGGNGYLSPQPAAFNPDTLPDFLSRLGNQEAVIASLVAQYEIDFVSLYDATLERAQDGEFVYYPFDTHWNQAGYDMAAEVMIEYFQTQTDCQ